MNLSPEEMEDIKERTAQILADRIEELVGDLEQFVVFPMSVASCLLSLSPRQIPTYLPITETAAGKHGVTLAALKAHIHSRTVPAKRKRKEAGQ